jgi:hypothetical protein
MTQEERDAFINAWCDEHPLFPELHWPGCVRAVGEEPPAAEKCVRALDRYALGLVRDILGHPTLDGRIA